MIYFPIYFQESFTEKWNQESMRLTSILSLSSSHGFLSLLFLNVLI